ncbi:MAG: hypothetical protein JSV54_04010 [Chloroflexota bacterium]|nr:MAG: hypothetical protein JSV54_04010 [Chloroflexota bacterium]
MPGKTQTLTAVNLLVAAIFIAALIMPVFRAGVAHALNQQSVANITQTISTDNQTTQETEWGIEQSGKQAELSNTISTNSDGKLYRGVEETISTMKPTDDIKLHVLLIMPADTANKIYEATAPIDKEIEEISAEIRRRGSSGTLQLQLEIKRLRHDRNEKLNAVLEEQFGEIRTRAKAAIEALPDTSIIGGTLDLNSLSVQTKVGNIEALTEIPEVVRIYISPRVVLTWWQSPIRLLSPSNGCLGCPVDQPSFSWEPYKETTKYKFVLAEDAAMTQIVKEAEMIGTSYEYDGKLDYRTNYFWRVMALEPVHIDWSATFSFQTEAAPPPPPEAPPQPTVWHPALIAGLIIVLAGAVGFATWFFVVRRHKVK